MIYDSILDTVGRTPVVRLQRLRPDNGSEILVKLEGFNPAGSVKDRPAWYIVRQAELAGDLRPGGTILESTSGNFGKSLALIGAARGYRVIVVVDPKAPPSMISYAEALGATIDMVDVPDEDGNYQRPRLRRVEQLLGELPDAFWPDQYNNPDNPRAHAESTAAEILEDVRHLDTLVAAVSTGGHLSGLAATLKKAIPGMRVLAVDADGSAIFGSPFHHYAMRGLGLRWKPGNLDLGAIDEIHRVTDREGFAASRVLARYEGLLVGESAGAAVFAALHHAHAHPGARIVVVAPDGGTNYLGESFDDAWLAERGIQATTIPVSPSELLEAARNPEHPPVGRERRRAAPATAAGAGGRVIETVNLVHIVDRKILLVRPHGKAAFYMPGGKREPGEDDLTALQRELAEELAKGVLDDDIQPYGVFEAQAYGEEPGTQVRLICYQAEFGHAPVPSSEIASIRYFSYEEYLRMPHTAPAVVHILEDLRARSLID